MDIIFSNSYSALKPGGIFGVVEHRAKEGTSVEEMKKSGYVNKINTRIFQILKI